MVSYNFILKCDNIQILMDKHIAFCFGLSGLIFFETKSLYVAIELVTFSPVLPKTCMTGLIYHSGLNSLFLIYKTINNFQK